MLKRYPTPEETKVTRDDLECIQEALRILSLLNDRYVSPRSLAPSVARMPALMARITRAYHQRFIGRSIPDLPEQLRWLGNSQFERMLFVYLEDLTELRAEIEEAEEDRESDP